MDNNQLFSSYEKLPSTWDEMYSDNAEFRAQYSGFIEYLKKTSPEKLTKKEDLSKQLFMSQGVTFTVYNIKRKYFFNTFIVIINRKGYM
jgi:uncharacterized circularly permuted ATP-grasp superfamily protein